jgi:hypothetical protein
MLEKQEQVIVGPCSQGVPCNEEIKTTTLSAF